jgi:tetratricopeptide (TPR) repeat protein
MFQPATPTRSNPAQATSTATKPSPVPAWLLAALLALVTLTAYWRAMQCDFVNFDDPDYVTSNVHVQNGLTLEGINWAFSHIVSANWHPLTMMSHMLDCQIYALKPWGHHLTSVLLHTLNTVLVFVLFRSLTGAAWRSFWVAALFALHPLHVESVAWISERKDVLSAFFGLLSLIFYARYARPGRGQWSEGSGQRAVSYGLALVFLALGLMSKAMLVTWPFVMLLLDYWPLNRVRNSEFGVQNFPQSLKTLVVEKIPFFALAVLSSVATLIVQAQHGAVQTIENLSVGARGENALISYGRYLGKLFWPAKLSVYYIYRGSWPLAVVLAVVVLLAGMTLLVWWQRKRYPFLLTGWLWYCGTLVPVIGLVQVGAQAMADRYTYLPSLGVLIIVVWGAYELARDRQALVVALSTAGALVIVACLGVTRQQLSYWRTSETLFGHALAVTDSNYMTHNGLGHAYSMQGRIDDAIAEYQEAIRLKFDFAGAHDNLGAAYVIKGRLDEAIGEFRKAIHFRPDYALYHFNLGVALVQKGQTNEAMGQFQEAIRLKPDEAAYHLNLGTAFNLKGSVDEAIALYQQSVHLSPDDPSTHYGLGLAFDFKGQVDDAIRQYQEAVRLKPDMAESHHFLGVDLGKKGNLDEALRQLQEAVSLKPDDAEVYNDLGNVLDGNGQTDEAIKQYLESIRLSPKGADAHGNLGAAYGKKGNLEGAISQLEEALRLQPDNALGHYNLGMVLEQKGRPAEAVRHYQEALRLNPDFAQARSNLTNALQEQNATAGH